VHDSRRLVLAHLWVAFGAMAIAAVLGVWQMYQRSPLAAWLSNPELYYRAVTAHGTVLAYVFPTLFAMGFGYAVATSSLDQPLGSLRRWAWTGFALLVLGAVVAAITIAMGHASVLYTFYPPLTAHPAYYVGVVLVVVGSWVWCGLMVLAFARFKRAHPGEKVPLAMYGTVANALLWAWTSIGAAAEVLLIVLPASLGWNPVLDAGLSRVLFSWTLHAIVYFWLLPAYVAFYTLLPAAAGGRLYSDRMGRLVFALFLVFSMPIGIHHLFADPQVGSGFKFLHAVFTGMVVIPTLLTVFTITASLEIAGRLRGGRGLFGWILALPWRRPMMLAGGLAFVMLAFGGAGGLINMSYALNSTVHNTQWVTAHFHLIFGGSAVIMYFAVAYELWPRLTGRPLLSPRLAWWQLMLWFVGMMVLSMPWHVTGIMGQPRRMAYFDYSHPALAQMAPLVIVSFVGALILLVSVALLLLVLWRTHRQPRSELVVPPLGYALAVDRDLPVPRALNGLGAWATMMVLLTVVNYAYPIALYFTSQGSEVRALRADGGR
jgi:cytochrome c oxidase subunit 1